MHVEFEDETVNIKELEIESQETMREMTLMTSIMTEQADETIMLANVLGMDVTELENISRGANKVIAAQRMVKFLDLLDKTSGLGISS
jgi:hypothetical protein